MRRFLVLLLVLIGSVWLGLKLAADPGYALFSYHNWSVEMPLWFAVLSFILLLCVLYFVLHFLESIDLSLYRFKNWLRWRRKNKSYSKTNRGLVELVEGSWRNAEHYLLEGVARSDAPLINYLALAKTAHEQHAYDRRDSYLRKAYDVAPQAEIATGLTQARLQLSQGQLEQALATLKHLYSLVPKQVQVLQLLKNLYMQLGDWSKVIRLLPNLRKTKIITSTQAIELEKTCYEELLRAAANAKTSDKTAIQKIWGTIPSKFQKDSDVLSIYAEYRLNDPSYADELELLVRKALKKSWNKKLARIYGLLQTTDSKKQLAQAQSWISHYEHQPVLLLTLGRLCVRCQLWGKARQYFEDSIKLDPAPETYIAYGKLLEQLGEVNLALQSYKDGLKRSV